METVLGKTIKSSGRNSTAIKHSEQISLMKDQTYAFDIRNKPVQMVGLSGRAWVTIQGDLKDYLIGQGEELTISHPGRLVIQGVPEVVFMIRM